MPFFKILDAIGTILGLILAAAIIYALYPYFGKLLEIVQRIHNFAH
jgi:hypothetical protein